jgi:hypothetical protein
MKEVFALFMLDVFAKKFKKSRAMSLHKNNCTPSTQLIPLSMSKLIIIPLYFFQIDNFSFQKKIHWLSLGL